MQEKNTENKILNMYFLEKKKQIEIANKLNISKYKVSRTLSKDPRYKEEKEYRRIINKKKHIEKTKKYISKKRKIERKNQNINYGYEALKRSHDQASRELSGSRNFIDNRSYKKWNSSAYEYESKSKSYVLKKGIIAGADVPKRIKWTNN